MEYKLKDEDIKRLIIWNGPSGCLATDKITVSGLKIGYMYRENVKNSLFPDSGWRFFSGTEDDDYSKDPEHIRIYDLNTICNYDSSIIPFLNSPPNSIFYKDADGNFKLENEPGNSNQNI